MDDAPTADPSAFPSKFSGPISGVVTPATGEPSPCDTPQLYDDSSELRMKLKITREMLAIAKKDLARFAENGTNVQLQRE